MAKKTEIKKEESTIPQIEKEESTIPQNVDIGEILKMMISLRQDMDVVKAQNEQLKKEKEELTTLRNNNFNTNERVTIINMFEGLSLNLKIDDFGRKKAINGFGGILRVSFDEAEDIIRLNQRFAKLGFFIIEDRKHVERLFLTEEYEKFVDKTTLLKLHSVDNKTLTSIYNNANIRYQEMIRNKFITEYLKNDDMRFRDTNKLKLLSKLSGEDLLTKVTEAERENQYRQAID